MTEARELVPRGTNLVLDFDISTQRYMASLFLLELSWCFVKPNVPLALGHSSPSLGDLPITCCKHLCSVPWYHVKWSYLSPV